MFGALKVRQNLNENKVCVLTFNQQQQHLDYANIATLRAFEQIPVEAYRKHSKAKISTQNFNVNIVKF